MDSIILENFRCFGARQVARLAPLTLLVGENSTGKTSFLALIRALWDAAVHERVPDFREYPYDLGSFREVAYAPGAGKGAGRAFTAGFTEEDRAYRATFDEQDTAPYPFERSFSTGNMSLEVLTPKSGPTSIKVSALGREWTYTRRNLRLIDDSVLLPMNYTILDILWEAERDRGDDDNALVKLTEGKILSHNDRKEIRKLQRAVSQFSSPRRLHFGRPFASAPVRSRPLRTYDPQRVARDPEGDYAPSYLAELYRRNQQQWILLKKSIEEFGENSGLFNDISIKSFERTSGSPFQILLRKHGKTTKGAWRNLVDVGYGVSQILPIIVDFYREGGSPTFLLQQPEVHLHPSAQAALGSLFCSIAAEQIAPNNRGIARRSRRQLIVETHSDYIIDRVRMDVRDKKTGLKPEDVSILFFERVGLDVKIHSLRIDEQGNVLDAPPSYGQFFLEETNRSIGI